MTPNAAVLPKPGGRFIIMFLLTNLGERAEEEQREEH